MPYNLYNPSSHTPSLNKFTALIESLENLCFENSSWNLNQIQSHILSHPFFLLLQNDKEYLLLTKYNPKNLKTISFYSNFKIISIEEPDIQTRLENKPIGYALYLENEFEVELLRIGIHPTMRRLGLCSFLIQALIKFTNYKDIYLEVDIENFPAIELYKKIGFQLLGKRKSYYQNGNDALVFQKKKNDFKNV